MVFLTQFIACRNVFLKFLTVMGLVLAILASVLILILTCGWMFLSFKLMSFFIYQSELMPSIFHCISRYNCVWLRERIEK